MMLIGPLWDNDEQWLVQPLCLEPVNATLACGDILRYLTATDIKWQATNLRCKC
jgi:hypothetical protein